MTTKKCMFCGRRVRQQDWKTEREKEICFTCNFIEDFIIDTVKTLEEFKGVDIDFSIKKITNKKLC